jgi:3-hydroxyacyl-[acyl-carrier-protein] dehydratase
VSKKALMVDPSEYDLNHIVADAEEIRRYNRQRFEMEQLTAIVYENDELHVCVGYKDLGPDEFWIRGHMPGFPLMPGVVMCEAAAQLASFYTTKKKLMTAPIIGFGGLKDVKFRGVVRPGERFVVACKLLKVRSQILTSEFQCTVRNSIVCEGVLMGIPLDDSQLKSVSA